MWMDATTCLPKDSDAEALFLEGGVGLSGGGAFGGGRGTVRLNLGCKRETLIEGLDRMEATIAKAWRDLEQGAGGEPAPKRARG